MGTRAARTRSHRVVPGVRPSATLVHGSSSSTCRRSAVKLARVRRRAARAHWARMRATSDTSMSGSGSGSVIHEPRTQCPHAEAAMSSSMSVRKHCADRSPSPERTLTRVGDQVRCAGSSVARALIGRSRASATARARASRTHGSLAGSGGTFANMAAMWSRLIGAAWMALAPWTVRYPATSSRTWVSFPLQARPASRCTARKAASTPSSDATPSGLPDRLVARAPSRVPRRMSPAAHATTNRAICGAVSGRGSSVLAYSGRSLARAYGFHHAARCSA
ncbi:hypothetical protein GALL_459820 [mine drainage metagenome]|uniref:Uncharacterized protein n=1 Tax=mine drainage metagenome TaxID=410659 RepID=A0A1J5PLH7_9ZZZZ